MIMRPLAFCWTQKDSIENTKSTNIMPFLGVLHPGDSPKYHYVSILCYKHTAIGQETGLSPHFFLNRKRPQNVFSPPDYGTYNLISFCWALCTS